MQLMREEALLMHRLCKGYLEEDDASLRIEALNRLKWNVLASPSTVEVVDLNKADELCWKPLSTDPKHPLAEEPVTSSSTSHIHIELAQIYYWECLGMIDKSPPPLLIHNSDGRAITVEQFVSEVSAYAQGLRGMIYETEDLSFGDSSLEEKERLCLYHLDAGALKSLDGGGMDEVFPLYFISNSPSSASNEASAVHGIREHWVWTERKFKEYLSRTPATSYIAPRSIDFAEASRNFRLIPQEVPHEETSLLCKKALDRLRWDLLAPPSTVQVIDVNEEGEPIWRSILVDPKHPLADEAVTEVPRSRMRIVFGMLEGWECWERYEDNPPPAPLLIENIDGKTITIEQFIVKVSEYAQSLRETIFECKGRAWSRYERACLWFDAVSGPKRRDAEDPDVLFYVGFTSNSWSSSNDIEADLVRKEKRFIENRSK